MTDFLDHDASETPVKTAKKTAKKVVKKQSKAQHKGSDSHFENAVQNISEQNKHKITFYLNDSDIEILNMAMAAYEIKRNDAMKLALANLRDRLEHTE